MLTRTSFRPLPRSLYLWLLCLVATGTAHAQNYRFIGQFGTSGAGQLSGPNTIIQDPQTGNFLVTDAGNGRVVVFNSAGSYVRAFGSSGSGNGQLDYPAGIRIEPNSHDVYVADYYNNRVEVFDSAGNYATQFGAGQVGEACDILFMSGGDILVTDGYTGTVQVYNSSRVYQSSFGTFGYSCGMAFDNLGNILVADQTSNDIQVFNTSFSALGSFGSFGSGNGQFGTPGPGGIALEPGTHNIVTADYGNDRIVFFSADHSSYLGEFGSTGSGEGQFAGPTAVLFAAPSGNLLVVDRGNSRIQEFAPCGPTLVSISALPQVQTEGQPILFTGSIGNVVSPGGLISMYDDTNHLICTVPTYGDPQAACSAQLLTGSYNITAVYSGDGISPSGCSQPVTVTVASSTTLTTTLGLTGPGNIGQGQPGTLTANVSQASGAPHDTRIATTAPSGFVTFSDGSVVIATVPLSGSQASFTNRFAAGTHHFSASYSGDGNYATSNDATSASVTKPSDDLFYSGFEVPPG